MIARNDRMVPASLLIERVDSLPIFRWWICHVSPCPLREAPCDRILGGQAIEGLRGLLEAPGTKMRQGLGEALQTLEFCRSQLFAITE